MENLWGSSIVQYEPDVGIIMNKEGLGSDGLPIIRIAIEKSRHGPSDLEFRHKYFGSAYTFDRDGTLVSEPESWQAERKMLREEKYSHKQDDSIHSSVMLQEM
jgi:hypothetical protein